MIHIVIANSQYHGLCLFKLKRDSGSCTKVCFCYRHDIMCIREMFFNLIQSNLAWCRLPPYTQQTVPKIGTQSPTYRRDSTICLRDPLSCCVMFVCWTINLRHITWILLCYLCFVWITLPT